MRPRLVIVGAGLGGCVLAHAMLGTHDVTVIERGVDVPGDQFPVHDTGRPAGLDPHFGSGLGGSTQLWHNGLIEIEAEVFAAHWPMAKSVLGDFYKRAFELLSKVPASRVQAAIQQLRGKYLGLGLPEGLLPGLFYPRSPVNAWEEFKLAGRVNVVRGEAIDFPVNSSGAVEGVTVLADGRHTTVAADRVVLAAGGLSSPILLQKLASTLPLPALRHAGCHYEDHPMGFVGELEVNVPLYRLWNFHVAGTGGNLRMPVVVNQGGLHIAFYLRPAAAYYRDGRRQRVGSMLNQLRQQPWNIFNYARLLAHWDDVLDILSFKFGIRLPTKHYTMLMTAQMPTSPECSVWSSVDASTGRTVAHRHWQLTPEFLGELNAAITQVLERLRPVVTRSRVFPEWQTGIHTAAHHSGTARMAASADTGVCDVNCRVHGVPNLYVCDGSVIPASGMANTGLTIAALALRLAEHLKALVPHPQARLHA